MKTRRRGGSRLLAIALAVAAASLVPVGGIPAAQAAPSVDADFHSPPAGFGSKSPGEILRERPVDIATMGLPLPRGVRGWQLLYRTTAADGSPSATVTTLIAPAQSASPPKLMSYQAFQDSTGPQCAPSRNLIRSEDLDGVLSTSGGLTLVTAALQRGWTVSFPDHQGPNSNFSAPREPGYAALDGMRAAKRFAPLGLDDRTPIVAAGYSGGALATGWVAEEQPSYAPELDLVGAAMGGTPVDIGKVPAHLEGSAQSGTGLAVINGLRHSYPAIRTAMDRYLTPRGRQTFDRIESACLVSTIVGNIAASWAPLFTAPFATVWADPAIQSSLQEARLGHRNTSVPRLISHAVTDEVVPIGDVDAFIGRQCDAGATLTVRREEVSAHVVGALGSLPTSMNWLDDRAAGRPIAPGCDITTVPSFITDNPGAVGGSVVDIVRGTLGI